MAKKIKIKKTKSRKEIVVEPSKKKKRKRRVREKPAAELKAKKIPLTKSKGEKKKRKKRIRIVKEKFVETIKEIKSPRFGRVIVKASIEGCGAVCRTADSTFSPMQSHNVFHLSWFFKQISKDRFEIHLPRKGDPESGEIVGVVNAVYKREGDKRVRRWRLNEISKTFPDKRIMAAIVYHLYKMIESNKINVSQKWFFISGPTTRYLLSGSEKWKSYATLPIDDK